MEETVNILKKITSNKLGVIKTATKLQGGIVNLTYKVVAENGEFVVRINNIDQINVFKKEMYCYDVAKKSGIPSPEVIDLYEDGKQCYLITKYIPGFSNKDIEKSKRTHVWRKLGEYSKLISQVKELPYGEDAQDSEDAKLQYSKGMLDYAIKEFAKKDDYFVVNNLSNSGEVARFIELLNNLKGEIEYIDFGLIHGDLTLSNVVLDENDTVYLIDWGSSNLLPTPEFQVMEIYLESILKESFKSSYFVDFLRGHELDDNYIMKNIEVINSMSLLNYTDKIRWAIDKNKSEALANYTDKLKKTKDQLLRF